MKTKKKGPANPKKHDNCFKWLLSSFTVAFFDFFFENLEIHDFESLDKEFIKKFEVLKESIKGDLFLVMQVTIDGKPWEIVILIELKSKREDVRKQIREYFHYCGLLRPCPVWCIVLYTDDAEWRKPPPNSFPLAYHSKTGIIHLPYDIIKLKGHKSADLIKHRSLLVKLLALKANDAGCDRKELIREIYRAILEDADELTNDQIRLSFRFVKYYSQLPEPEVEELKEEFDMTFVADTITEAIQHEAGLKGKLEMLESFHKRGPFIASVIGT